MMDFFFFVKTFILTVAVVLVMQMEVGDGHQTLETVAMSWVQTSGVTSALRSVGRGGAKLVHDLSHQVTNAIHSNVSKGKDEDTRTSKRESSFHWTHTSSKPSQEEDRD